MREAHRPAADRQFPHRQRLFDKQDQGYSNGVQLTLVSPNLVDYTDDPCLPRLVRWINRRLNALTPRVSNSRT